MKLGVVRVCLWCAIVELGAVHVSHASNQLHITPVHVRTSLLFRAAVILMCISSFSLYQSKDNSLSLSQAEKVVQLREYLNIIVVK